MKGIPFGKVTNIKAKLDIDNDSVIYNVKFTYSNARYEYSVNVLTGEVLAFEKENSTDKVSHISEEKALQIALDYANVSKNRTDNMKIKFEIDKGKAYYEIEWKIGEKEYECKINAETGKVIELDID